MITHIDEVNFKEEVLKEKGLVIVDFSADWCMPCKLLSKILESVANEFDNVKIAKVDVDENPFISDEYGIQSIPAIKVFKDGNLIDEAIGFMPRGEVIELIKDNL